ncbi:hypothetical protein DXA81_12735 [Bacteroides fragilis]|jgi:hypothetical protein|nr:hypothetical protein DXC86_22130 [Bacteroides fragilis]RGO96075.1 hypothetical protein DXA81_12735 [Bacteroides fragilis]RGZ85165.1 hypothetical protein DW968_10980 [Bacteroides fragilis]
MANGLALFVLKSIMKCTGMVIDKKHANNRDVQIILSCFSDMAIAFSQRHDKFMNQKLEMIAFRMSSQYQVDFGKGQHLFLKKDVWIKRQNYY